MKSDLILRPSKRGKKPSTINLRLQIDDARMILEGKLDALNSHLEDRLVEWETKMQNLGAEEPIF